jgi:hypothetical protein
MTALDEEIIRGIAEYSPSDAAKIFVTGEASESYLGEKNASFLIGMNSAYYDAEGGGSPPVFVRTRNNTVRMLRFDPKSVWRWIAPGVLAGLVKAEAGRLGVKMNDWDVSRYDFYQSMVEVLRAKTGDAIALTDYGHGAESYYNAAYLSCLLLFNKPGLMGVPIAEHFAQPSAAEYLRGAKALHLDEAARERLSRLRGKYGRIETLTDPEAIFVLDTLKSVPA